MSWPYCMSRCVSRSTGPARCLGCIGHIVGPKCHHIAGALTVSSPHCKRLAVSPRDRITDSVTTWQAHWQCHHRTAWSFSASLRCRITDSVTTLHDYWQCKHSTIQDHWQCHHIAGSLTMSAHDRPDISKWLIGREKKLIIKQSVITWQAHWQCRHMTRSLTISSPHCRSRTGLLLVSSNGRIIDSVTTW